MELRADAATLADGAGPVHDERNVNTPFMGVLLVPLERSVARLGPAPRVVRVAVGTADVIDAGDGLVRRLDEEVEELHLVEHSERTALLTGSVVGEHDEQGVVESPLGLDGIDEATDLGVGVLDEGGKGLLETTGQALLVLPQGVPGFDAGIARGELGLGRDDP